MIFIGFYKFDLLQSNCVLTYLSILLIIKVNQSMNPSKLTTPTNRNIKQVPKSLQTNVTSRSGSQYNGDNPNPKRQSRTKVKKENTQNSNITSQRNHTINARAPFTEFTDNTYKTNRKQNHQAQTLSLRENNQNLENKISVQANELKQLKEAINSIKGSISQTKSSQQTSKVDKKNSELQKKVQQQDGELQNLKKQIYNLRQAMQERTSSNMKSSLTGDSKVSIRAQYARLYQTNIPIKEAQQCQNCCRHQQEMDQMRVKYGNQLRRLQSQIASFRQKSILLEVLQLQVQHKNQCIDYLRSQLQRFQINSKHLLGIVNTLQNRLSLQQGINIPSKYNFDNSKDESFHSFSHRY